jgi:hypothetical protein
MCGCPVFPEAFVEGNLDDASSYILLPQHCFGSLGSSLVPYEFWDFFPLFSEERHWYFYRDCIDIETSISRIVILTVLIFGSCTWDV